MALKTGLLVILVVVICISTIPEITAFYLAPKGQLNEILKRSQTSEISPPREKRYSDFQEKASAFCTGLCMYEENRPYTECFDMCNWNDWSSAPAVYRPGNSSKNRRHLTPSNDRSSTGNSAARAKGKGSKSRGGRKNKNKNKNTSKGLIY